VAASPSFRLEALGELRLSGPLGPVFGGRRKELLLLACILRRGPRGISRDDLAALLWGERDEEKARQSLRQALHQLRRALGNAIEVTSEDVRVRPDAIDFDVTAFESDINAGQWASAVSRWRGDFLRNAEDAGTDDYRSWLERERETLRRQLQRALGELVDSGERIGDEPGQLRWSERWVELFPLDENANIRLIGLLTRTGDLHTARARHSSFMSRLREELDMAPSPAMLRLGEQLGRASAGSRPGRPGSAALLTPDLIGRDAVLASLLDLWSRAGTESAVVLIEGEEGIGKSRLCAEFSREVRKTGPALLLADRAAEADHNEPWSTLRRLLAPLVRSPAVEEVPNKALGELSDVLPSLRERYPHLASPSGQSDRLAAGLCEVLKVVATQTAVLLILDDYPLADEHSATALLTQLRLLPTGAMAVVTRRSRHTAEPDTSKALTELHGLRRITLQPLTQDDVGRLIGSMLEITPSDHQALTHRLFAEGGGNPFYVTSLVSALADTGVLSLGPGGVWRLEGDLQTRQLPLPHGLRAAISERLSHLSEPARQLIETLAAGSTSADVSLIRDTLDDPGTFGAARDELLSRRLLRPVTGDPQRFEFAHDMVRRLAAERGQSTALATSALGAPREPWRRRLPAIALGILALAGAVAVARSTFWGNAANDASRNLIPRIAVLDLELAGADSVDAYLASGVAEEINSSLARFDDIRLKSRGAVRTARQAGMTDPAQLGKALSVDFVVEGSVRHAGDRLRVTIRLTKTADGFQLWSHVFEAAAGELAALHERIAGEVATRVGSQLSPGEIAIARRQLTNDDQAYEHYLRGNYFLARRTPPAVERAIGEYRLAVARDSLFAAALARIAYSYSILLDWGWAHGDRSPQRIMTDGLALVARALEIDSLSADAWMARAYLLESADPVAMRGAAEAFERALAINPRNAEALHQYAQVFQALGQWAKAREVFRRTLALEPDRSLPYVSLASIAWKEGNTGEARQLYDSALVVDPGASYVLSARAMLRLETDDVRGGLDDAETAVRVEDGYSIPPHSALAIALARTGARQRADAEADRVLSEIADPTAPSPTDARWIASALLAVGRRTDALNLIERARPRGAWLWFYFLAADFAPIRDDPRFLKVMREARPPALGNMRPDFR
jgi:DNA-binding SARP family transcriptional activator/TolB-like protein